MRRDKQARSSRPRSVLTQDTAFGATGDRFVAERNSALIVAILHYCVVVGALFWDSPLFERRNLQLWTAAQAILGLIALYAFWCAHTSRIERFGFVAQIEGIGTAITFSALAWLGPDVASQTPSKYVLMITLIAVTSVSAANSSYLTRRRPFFRWLTLMVAISYSLAYLVAGEWEFSVLTVLWCVSIAVLTRVGYHGMLELLELRTASERTARHDDLTGLLSRSAFFATLGHRADEVSAVPEAKREGLPPIALALFDLDGFKAINDSFGHAAGDAVLSAIANRLSLFLPADAEIGRLGGDEFAAVFAAHPDVITSTIDAALGAVSEPIRLDGRELFVAASAGWTVVKPDREPAELMAEADAAMYQSKNSHHVTSTGFDTALRDQLDRSLDMRHRFRAALKRDEIDFWIQPIVRAFDGAPTAFELLARWPQEDGTMIEPFEFTRVAEETGLAVDLDRKALRAAATLLAHWSQDPILGALIVKANISPVHLHNGELLQSIHELVPRAHWRRLGIEIVESRLVTAAERNHMQMEEIIDMGITLSIDDFGVGYSSLAYLRTLPISEIKIDRSFVTALDSDRVNQGLVRAVVDIANTLGLPTVAEGIETPDELAMATTLGVTFAQGFYLGRPHPIEPIDSVRETIRLANRL